MGSESPQLLVVKATPVLGTFKFLITPSILRLRQLLMQEKYPIFRTGIGQDSHRFLPPDSSKPCILGGVIFEGVPGLDADSDGDIIFHAICNAISSLSGVPILGAIAKELCRKDGITDSQVYVEKALKTLGKQTLVHVALTIEGKRPRLEDQIKAIRKQVSRALLLPEKAIGLTATSGEGLTDVGCGDGLQCFCVVTTVEWSICGQDDSNIHRVAPTRT